MLLELLAEKVHNTYVQGRLAEGWTLGPRNDEKKTNPTLIPYDELSESEKEYDRRTALETINTILSLGYQIVPVDPSFIRIEESHGDVWKSVDLSRVNPDGGLDLICCADYEDEKGLRVLVFDGDTDTPIFEHTYK